SVTKLAPVWTWGLKPSPGSPRGSRRWGLVSAWQHLSPCAGAPTISIFLKPPGVIPPGGSTTICCHCQCDDGNVVLYKDGQQLRILELRDGRAEFPISNATQEDAGPYSCHYLAGGTVLARSETLEIMVEGEGCALTSSRGVRLHTDARSHLASPSAWWAGFFPSSLACRGGDHLYLCLSEVVGSWRSHLLMPSSLPIEFHLPKPVLSVLPGLEVAAGAYVTFRCTITHASAGCFLYLEGQDKALDLLPKDQDDFNLSRVHKGNEGRYSCQCFTKGALWNWSDVSNSLDLVVKGETSSPAASNSSLPLLPHPGRTRKEDAEEGRPAPCPCPPLSLVPLGGAGKRLWVWGGPGAGMREVEPLGLLVNPLSLFSPAVSPCPCVCLSWEPHVCPFCPLGSPVSPMGGLLVGVPSDRPFLSPADYTWSNVVRLALGAAVLVLLGLIVAEDRHGHCCMWLGWERRARCSLRPELPTTGSRMGTLGFLQHLLTVR
uniref:Ig-like domain-containing protein n=1 Tax=Strigops habroptila TaxID=2489341 RepID=A0A672U284_STRHB